MLQKPPRNRQKPLFSEQLITRARRLVAQPRAGANGKADDVAASLENEIALVLSQLDEERSLHADSRQSLLREECYTNTELMQMEQRTPPYSPYRYPEREKLQRRLHDIEKERRSLKATSVTRRQRLEERLLEILERHAILSGGSWR